MYLLDLSNNLYHYYRSRLVNTSQNQYASFPCCRTKSSKCHLSLRNQFYHYYSEFDELFRRCRSCRYLKMSHYQQLMPHIFEHYNCCPFLTPSYPLSLRNQFHLMSWHICDPSTKLRDHPCRI